jgi:hypothetical protein
MTITEEIEKAIEKENGSVRDALCVALVKLEIANEEIVSLHELIHELENEAAND